GAADVPRESYAWLKDHSQPDDLVVSMDIARVYYYAGRRGVHFIPSSSPEDFVRRARELKAKFFVLDSPAYVEASPGVVDGVRCQHDRLEQALTGQNAFQLIYQHPNEGTRIFRWRPTVAAR